MVLHIAARWDFFSDLRHHPAVSLCFVLYSPCISSEAYDNLLDTLISIEDDVADGDIDDQ